MNNCKYYKVNVRIEFPRSPSLANFGYLFTEKYYHGYTWTKVYIENEFGYRK